MDRRILIRTTLAACFIVTTAVFAADNFSGTWKTADGKQTVKIETIANGLKATVHAPNNHDEWSAKFDGKEHPRANNQFVTLTRIDDYTYEQQVKDKDHKVVTTRRVTHSRDGKTRTTLVTHPDGHKSTTVYTRQ